MSNSSFTAKLLPLKKPAIIAVVLLGLYTICGFLVAPVIIKAKAPTIIAEQLGRKATVKQITVNPFVLSLTVRGFELEEANHALALLKQGKMQGAGVLRMPD